MSANLQNTFDAGCVIVYSGPTVCPQKALVFELVIIK